MLGVERRLQILGQVAEQQSVHVGELSRALGVSEMTIRRDIRRLERDGFLRRTHGGATTRLTRALHLAINARSLENTREKRLIGMAAARRVAGATSIFLGVGTTAEQFAQHLRTGAQTTVVTNSLPAASLLGTRPVRTVVLGGSVRRDELSVVGPVANATLSRYHFEVAVIGAAGVTARDGVTDLNEEEVEINRVAADRADRVMVIADSTKLGTTSMVSVIPVERVDMLVTDSGAPDDRMRELRELGVEVIIASELLSEPEDRDQLRSLTSFPDRQSA